jgi:drug/metabolite transporter (DMT)-like permease
MLTYPCPCLWSLSFSSTRAPLLSLTRSFLSFLGFRRPQMFKWIMVRMHLSAALSAVWRNQCIILLLIPPTLVEWARAEPDERAVWWAPVKESEAATASAHHVVLYVAFIAVVWAANLYLYVKSLEFTSTVRTTLFANTQPLILMAYFSVVKGVRHSLGEQVGVVLAIAGIGMALLDDSGAAAQQVGRSPFVGDLMGLGVAFLMSVNIVVIGRVRKTVPLFVYTLSSITGMTIVLAFAAVAFEGAHFGGGDAGVWGFVEPEHARFFLFIGFLNGCFGMLSRNFCIKHIPPVVFSIFALLGPVITGWMVYFVGLEGARCDGIVSFCHVGIDCMWR